MAKVVQTVSRSVFRCGKEVLREEYTKKWIVWINLLENRKGTP